MNKVFLVGNFARDPELRQTQSGKSYMRNAVAVNHARSKNQPADFYNVLAWEKTAEFISKYFKKGSKILIEGHLQPSSYEKDGIKYTGVDIVIDSAEFADGKKGDSNNRNDVDDYPPPDEEDTPF